MLCPAVEKLPTAKALEAPRAAGVSVASPTRLSKKKVEMCEMRSKLVVKFPGINEGTLQPYVMHETVLAGIVFPWRG